MTAIDEIISGIDSLKPVTYVGDRVMKIITDPDSSMADLVELVKYDQSLTVNLLKLSNSAYVGSARKITSVKQALTMLGMDRVVSMIMLANSAENFRTSQEGYDLVKGELWKYSVSSAIIAQELATEKKTGNISMIFTAALIKDIGKVILSTHVLDAWDAVQEKVGKKGQTFLEAERAVLGIDHAELGAMVAERWHFDPRMVEIIRFHHEPFQAPSSDLALAVVYVADCICMMIGQGVGADGLAYRYYQDTVDRLGVTAVDLQKIIVRFREKYEEIEALINISGGIQTNGI